MPEALGARGLFCLGSFPRAWPWHLAGVGQGCRAVPGLSWCQPGASECTDWGSAWGPVKQGLLMGRRSGFAASGQAGLGKGLGGKWPPALQVPGTAVPWWCCWGSVSLSGPCLGCNGYSVLFQCSMEELGRGAHRPAGKFLSSVLICHIPSTSSAGAGGQWLTLGGGVCVSFSPARLCQVPNHTGLPLSGFSESAPLVPGASSPTAQLLCYRLGQPPHSWRRLGGLGDLPTRGPRTAGPKAPLG